MQKLTNSKDHALECTHSMPDTGHSYKQQQQQQQQQHSFKGLSSRTIWVGQYQKDKPFWILQKQR